MKNLILLILLTVSTSIYAQIKDKKSLIEEMNNFFYRGKIEKLDALTSEISSGKYGDMDDELKFYTMMYSLNIHTRDKYAKKNPQIGYDKAIEIINFTKVTSFKVPDKDTYIKSLNTFLTDYLKKYPDVKTVSTQNTYSSNSQNTIISNSENRPSASDNKTVTLTVSGTGKTLEEAKLNALRSAIEQAFGTFISSKTEILNDNLVKDEIVSVSNGNIQKYDVISQVEIPDNGYAITLKATVSIEKLTSFAQSKGVTVEFKGGMFGLKIKLQKLNEKNELNACINILSVVHELLQVGYDYALETEEPKLYKDTKYTLKFKVTGKPNSNFYKAMDYLKSSLSNLQMSKNEILEYENTNKKTYEFRDFHLRNELSYKTLKNIDSYANYYAGNFNLIINNEKKISGPDLGGSFNEYSWQQGYEPYTFPSFMFHGYPHGYYDSDQFSFIAMLQEIEDEYKGNTKGSNPISLTENPVEFQWKQLFDLAEIEKFNSITIIGKGVNSRIKHGGFVIYEDEARLIIASPYHFDWEPSLYIKPGITTSKKIFEGKSNMKLLKDDQNNNTLYDLVLKFNIDNNTEWHIPSEEELKLYVKEVYSTHSRTNEENSIICSSTIKIIGGYGVHLFCFNSRPESERFSFRSSQKYGIPFNSYDSFEFLEPNFNEYRFNQNYIERSKIPLVKYINK